MNLVVYYPFIIKVLDTLLNLNSYVEGVDHIKKEGQNLM